MYRWAVLLGMMLVCVAGCVTTATLPPALPDASHGFSSAWLDDAPGFPTPEQRQPPMPDIPRAWVVPVPQQPPPEFQGKKLRRAARERKRSTAQIISDANAGALVGPTKEAYWHNESAILRYPYAIGKLYPIISAVNGPTLVVLPPGQRLAAAPMLHTGGDDPDWEYKALEVGDGPTRQEALMVHPLKAGLKALMPLVTVQGLTFLCQLTSQDAMAMAQVTWELPLVPSVITPIPTGQDARVQRDGLVLSGHPAKEDKALQEPPKRTAPTIALDRLHTAYTIEVTSKAKPPWTPVQVFDDGRQTVIRFREPLTYTDAPVVLGVYSDGSPALIEFSTYTDPAHPERGLWYLVAGLYPRLVLKGADHLTVRITRVPTQ